MTLHILNYKIYNTDSTDKQKDHAL